MIPYPLKVVKISFLALKPSSNYNHVFFVKSQGSSKFHPLKQVLILKITGYKHTTNKN